MPTVEELLVEIKADTSALKDGLAEAESDVGGFGDHLAGIGKVAAGAMAAIGTAAVAAGAFGVKAASDWETAWTAVQQDVSGTAEELDVLGDHLGALAEETGFAREELAGMASALGEAGFAAADIDMVSGAVADFAAATGTAIPEASAMMSEFVKRTGTAPEALEGLLNSVVATAGAMKTSDTALLGFVTRLAPTGQALGLTTEALVGLGGAFLGAGGDADQGGQAIGTLLTNIQTALADTSDAGKEHLDAMAQRLGYTGEQFRQAFQEDAAGAIQELVRSLGNLQGDATATAGFLDAFGVSGGRTRDSLLLLAGALPELSNAMGIADEATANNLALSEDAAAHYEDFSVRLAAFGEKVKGVGIGIGEALMPVAGQLLDALGPILEDLAPVVADLAGSIASAFADVLPVISGLLKELMPVIKGFVERAAPIFGRLLEALAPLVEAMLPVVDVLLDALLSVFEAILPAIEALVPALVPFIDALSLILEAVLPPLMPIIEDLAGLLGELLVSALQSITPLLVALAPVLGFIAEVLATVVGWVVDFIEWLGELSGGMSTLDLVVLLVEAGLKAMGIIIATVVDVVRSFVDAIQGAWTAMTTFFGAVVGAVGDKLDAIRDFFHGIGEFFTDFFPGLVEDFLQWGKDLIQGLWDGVVDVWNSFVDWLDDAWESVKDKVSLAFDMHSPSGVFRDYGQNIVAGFKQGLDGLADAVPDALGDPTIGLRDASDRAALASTGAPSSGSSFTVGTIVLNPTWNRQQEPGDGRLLVAEVLEAFKTERMRG